jgi:hypothetical protein
MARKAGHGWFLSDGKALKETAQGQHDERFIVDQISDARLESQTGMLRQGFRRVR